MPTLFDKIWDSHVVADLGAGEVLIHVDCAMLHDLGGSNALADLAARGLSTRAPMLAFATPDHAIGTAPVPGRRNAPSPVADGLLDQLRQIALAQGIALYDDGDAAQGIVHVTGPAMGMTLPGMTIVCADSHTCTHGALGALGWGIGSTDLTHVLATSTVVMVKPRQMRLTLTGTRRRGTRAKDVALALIRRFGPGFGAGHAIEYAGPALDAMTIEERLTLANMAVELGARFGIMVPDVRVTDWLDGRPFAPSGNVREAALTNWAKLSTDADARFDAEFAFDVGSVAPQITWGISLDQCVDLDGRVPDPNDLPPAEAERARAALDYIGLAPGQPMLGTPIDWVFIGSCTNGRLSDLRLAAEVLDGRCVPPGVTAWVSPGSTAVKRQAEAEGVAARFIAAGFEWRESGCSLCCAANGEAVPPGKRAVSTTNRNFMGRQGPKARTHVASPEVAVASALAGAIAAP